MDLIPISFINHKMDRSEKLGRIGFGLLQPVFGRTLVVTQNFNEKMYQTKIKVISIVLAILILPVTLILAGIGYIALANSKSYVKIKGKWINSLKPPRIDPQNPEIKINDTTTIIKHLATNKYVLITKAPPIENLVISGGGAKGVVLIGVFEALEKHDIRKQIKNVAGSSIGAVKAALFAAGMTSQELATTSKNHDFKALLGDGTRFLNTFKTGLPLLKFLRDNIHNSVANRLAEHTDIPQDILDMDTQSLTFSMLRRLHQWNPETFKELTVTVTNKDTGKTEYFNADTKPNVEIALACRASASLPIVLEPVVIEGQTYVDGGYLDNIPVKCMEQNVPAKDSGERGHNLKTLALVFDDTGREDDEQSPFGSVKRKDHELYRPSIKQWFLRDFLAKKIAGINTTERNTVRKEEGLEEVRENYTQRNIPLLVALKTRAFKKAKKLEEKYRIAGLEQASEYFENHKNELMYRTFDTMEDLNKYL